MKTRFCNFFAFNLGHSLEVFAVCLLKQKRFHWKLLTEQNKILQLILFMLYLVENLMINDSAIKAVLGPGSIRAKISSFGLNKNLYFGPLLT